MFFETVEIKNFRKFAYLKLNFKERVSVLVGKNGKGKTTVLEALAISAGTLFQSFNGLSAIGIKKTDVHDKFYEIGNVIDVQPQYPVTIMAEGNIDGRSIAWKRSLNSENGRTLISDAAEMVHLSSEYQERLQKGDKTLILPVIAYYGTGRLWDQHREKKKEISKKNTRTNGYLDTLDGTTNVKLMLSWFRKMARHDSESSRPDAAYKVVREAMETCFRSITGIEDVKVSYNIDTLEIDVSYKRKNGDVTRIPLNQLSDGYRCALSMIADIAYRMAVLNPQLGENTLKKTSGIVLIDEVDLHLHPEWQQRILGDLKSIFPNVQFIVTTHAPSVINSVKRANIVIIDENASEPAVDVYGKDANSILESVMETTARPEKINEEFQKIYKLMDQEQYEEAKCLLNHLEDEIGEDPELIRCRVQLDLETLGDKDT